MYSDKDPCCFYWANDYEGTQVITGELGQYGCGASIAESTQWIEDFFDDVIEEFGPVGLDQFGSKRVTDMILSLSGMNRSVATMTGLLLAFSLYN